MSKKVRDVKCHIFKNQLRIFIWIFQRNICFNFLFALFDIFENNGGAWMDIQCTM